MGDLCDFRPNSVRQSVGLVDRKCSDSEVLQRFLEMEYSREQLVKLADESAKVAREAQKSAQCKSDFLAMVSHEIRTPLNGIVGMTSILLSSKLPPAERDYVETIRSSGEALLSIVDDVLDFSKIEAGKLELECNEFEVSSLIKQVLDIVQHAAARKSIRVCIDLDPALPKTVRGDVGRLRQILLNLISNAIKFTPIGKVHVKAEVSGSTPGEYELLFSVSDEGIGICEAEQAKLFRPFSQADASINGKFGGTGLGLAICKNLVELMGGSIGVRSKLGQGSSFWFTVKVLASFRTPPAATGGFPQMTDTVSTHFRILLVDDNAINKKVAILTLNKLGFKADVASNGREALDRLACQQYDLILMDCLMPEMDGFEATRRIRAKGGYGAQVPIIAMTANAFAEDREACLAAGMTDYLSKPIRQAELSSKLNFWLSGSSGRFCLLPVSVAS